MVHCLPWQGITIVIPHTLGNTPKKLFLPGGHSSKSAGGNAPGKPLIRLAPPIRSYLWFEGRGQTVKGKPPKSGSKSDHRIKKNVFFSILHVRLFTGSLGFTNCPKSFGKISLYKVH